MSLIASIVITLCSIFPTWLVSIALSFISLVAIIIILKIISLVLDATPFL